MGSYFNTVVKTYSGANKQKKKGGGGGDTVLALRITMLPELKAGLIRYCTNENTSSTSVNAIYDERQQHLYFFQRGINARHTVDTSHTHAHTQILLLAICVGQCCAAQ